MSGASAAADLPHQQHAVIADERVGVNGAIAAALTRWAGSMPALYVTVVVVAGYMALATWWGPLHRVDGYPFPFLLFLDNVVQVVLCLVILVGQRVLGAAADRRAVQTYESAEAIFERIAGLQAHLDRQDRALSRGVSLLETSAHPWIERHRVHDPPQAFSQAVGVNGRFAAWLTGRLGSVWAFYLAAASQVAWIVLAQVGVQRFDPYPFAFMSFLSTLFQLLFMIVIMVGQDVLGRAGDQRSEQTFLDAEAVLHECLRMEVRLTAQDRVIDALSGYATVQLIEQLARALHEADAVHAIDQQADGAAVSEVSVFWDRLPQQDRDRRRAQAWWVGESLAAIGCLMVPAVGATFSVTLREDEVERLARLEYERWIGELGAAEPGLGQGAGVAGGPVAWPLLPGEHRERRVRAAGRLPALLAEAGFQVIRDARSAEHGPGEEHFAPEQWQVLQRALMACGLLVGLAVGVVDAEEYFALVKTLRETGISHPRRFIRELAASSTFATGLEPGIGYRDYLGPALETIRSAAAIVEREAPGELDAFRTLLAQIATAVADANAEGGFFGLGAQRRTPEEAAAIEQVNKASGLSDADRTT